MATTSTTTANPMAVDVAGNHVLVVDDDPGVRGTIEAILRDEGYTVVTAVNGRDALHRIEAQPPALVLLDLQMPVMDGWQVMDALRASGRRVPVVFMTAGLRAHTEATRYRADGALPKPFDIDQLVTVVERFAAAK